MFPIHTFWRAVLEQDKLAIKSYFHSDAYVNWHNTNEHFTVDEFIRANCEYPGDWAGEIERTETLGDLMITVTHVHTKDASLSFHVTSFLRIHDEKITSIDEYWGDDGDAPAWRRKLKIGTAIRK